MSLCFEVGKSHMAVKLGAVWLQVQRTAPGWDGRTPRPHPPPDAHIAALQRALAAWEAAAAALPQDWVLQLHLGKL